MTKAELYLFHSESNLHLSESFDKQKLNELYDALAKFCRCNISISNSSNRILKLIKEDVSSLIDLIRNELNQVS